MSGQPGLMVEVVAHGDADPKNGVCDAPGTLFAFWMKSRPAVPVRVSPRNCQLPPSATWITRSTTPTNRTGVVAKAVTSGWRRWGSHPGPWRTTSISGSRRNT